MSFFFCFLVFLILKNQNAKANANIVYKTITICKKFLVVKEESSFSRGIWTKISEVKFSLFKELVWLQSLSKSILTKSKILDLNSEKSH